MKQRKLLSIGFVLLLTAGAFVFVFMRAGAAFNPNNLIDDGIFSNSNSMTAAQIDTFLNNFGSNSCISTNSGFEARVPSGYTPSGGFTYGNFTTAGTVIATAAQVYGINPRVLLTTLQKEQSLVNSSASYCNDGDEHKYAAAAGYGCPDGGTVYNWSGVSLYRRYGSEHTNTGSTCVNSAAKAGFSQQVIRAAWLLKFGQQRSKGNTNWAVVGGSWDNSDDPYSSYSGPMTQGSLKRCNSCSTTYYDGYTTIDGTATHMDSGGTAALYWYTPHFHGNQNFVSIYEGWFGSTVNIDAGSVINSLPVTIVTQPAASPAVGQSITYTVSFKNNFADPVTLDAVGAVGRAGNMSTGTNRDFGWQGPLTLAAGASQQFTFTTSVYDSGPIFIWPSVIYKGIFIQYNNWGTTLAAHAPNFTLSQPLTMTPTTVYAGQNVTFSAKLKNNEPYPINYDAIGIPVKFYNRYNYDAAWVGPGVIAPGAEITLSGTRNIDKPGPFTYWVSNYFGGTFSTIGSVHQLSSLEVVPNFSVSGITFSNSPPVVGQNLGASFTITNNLPIGIDVDAVGIIGRLGTFNGSNRDIGWQGPVHFNAGETKTFSGLTRNITDLRTHYYWIRVLYKGGYYQYNNWGSTIVS
ncbi:MAG TPA: hypothetical protein VLE69_02925, partial [Candidatus Saccharimonadales bacterium]|nr:hypothetical protein [Candidatus Saccharimonadales bacterium]